MSFTDVTDENTMHDLIRLALTVAAIAAIVSGCGKAHLTGPSEKPTSPTTSAQPSASSEFWEGVNYKRLDPTVPTESGPGEIEVTELFWYTCPYCDALDPFIEKWRRAGKPDRKSVV